VALLHPHWKLTRGQHAVMRPALATVAVITCHSCNCYVVLAVDLKGHFTLWKKNPYTEGLLCLLLHSEVTAIFLCRLTA